MALWNRILFPVSNIWDHGGGGGQGEGPSGVGNPTSAGGSLRPEPIDPTQNSQTQYLRSLTNLLGSSGESNMSSGQKTYADGKALFDGPTNYYSPILNGDRGAALSAEAPEVRTILSQYDNARKSLAEFAPRGGGRASGGANLEFQQAGDINSLLQKARPDAAAKLTDIARIMSSLGISQEQLGLQGLSSAQSGVLGKSGQDITENENIQKLLAGMGAGIGKLLAAGGGSGGGG